MTWFAPLFSAIMTVFVAAILVIMPALMASTVPLGVSIPAVRTDEPVISEAVRAFRRRVLGSLVISLLVTILLDLVSPTIGMLVPVLLMLALSGLAYVTSRRRIQRAKRDGDWYRNVPAEEATATEPSTGRRASIPVGWYFASLLALVIAAAVGVSRYDALPADIPTHWNGAGIADIYQPKSVWSVFGPLLIGIATVVFLYLVAFAVRFAPPLRTAAASTSSGREPQQSIQGVLGQITLATALLFVAMTLYGWFTPTASWLLPVTTIAYLVAVAAIVIGYALRMRQPARRSAVAAGGLQNTDASGPVEDAPDDDRHWKGGMLYFNRSDPALMVPKRFGIGWTVNLGHPAGMSIGVLLLVVIIGSVTWGIIAGG